MQPPERSLELLESMLAELEAYLGSAELFWPLALRPDLRLPHVPRLTIGNLLLTLDELEVVEHELGGADRTRLSGARSRWEDWRTRRVVAVERKAGREIEARWRMWQTYLNELSERAEAADEYPAEVRNRLRLARLMETIDPRSWPAHLEDRLEAADERLRSGFRKGAFTLTEPLKQRYPPFEYWYLYGAPEAGLPAA